MCQRTVSFSPCPQTQLPLGCHTGSVLLKAIGSVTCFLSFRDLVSPYNQADFLGERSVDLFVDSFCCFETDFLETQAGGEKL